ncbi:hypothetical protein P168DRAFT_269383 [Aspergillus campestris IBT 28561]|uniref:Uncharacterized protein n=1 Tax=Aspergillus campestris (strain IBT 28561) TaxID=1392248 RepID=A0A2I1D3K1_ASPC2|nr:uncharacterized protein P168DRAFT_269383 [Aspergillus campestris IBT 28561]PKY04449.1 hypothetical protein P168DRAFT_269383 [Aspergillus campestris IBT 28561]
MLALRSPQIITRPSSQLLHSVPRIALSPKPLRNLSHAASLSRTSPPRTHHYLRSRSLRAPTAHATRTLATTASGKSQSDLIIEEIQELYETAKDEFEIATDSTDSATIYAASDRESARDALNDLLSVYALYTTPTSDRQHSPPENSPEQQKGEDADDSGRLVSTQFDPAELEPEVQQEVKRRVGQRIRELKNAVQLLEERAMSD